MSVPSALAYKNDNNVSFDFEWLKQESENTVAKAYNMARLSAMCD